MIIFFILIKRIRLRQQLFKISTNFFSIYAISEKLKYFLNVVNGFIQQQKKQIKHKKLKFFNLIFVFESVFVYFSSYYKFVLEEEKKSS